nr:immunoglobulin heavy chain junction region [Macaca mulatta]MOX00093.1 immunoglobulin heavy chain junction region [Macaca mulatta]MOX05034.1 immunoglobulin heavy chain junction region [Macaca mulatta]MOX06036.1 immunoglobulin heavy chain junction region [Macaca mulatta]MOX06562.1 immunoglobulin heavy chain junction region [Macaca mulatta]
CARIGTGTFYYGLDSW